MANDDIAETRASVSSRCQGDCETPCPDQAAISEKAFWQEAHALLIQMVCLIERHKLGYTHTTSELRKAGKAALCNDRTP